MFEFAGGVGLGVDVGDFFQFEGTFQGDGELIPAAKEKGVILVDKGLGDPGNLAIQGEKVPGTAG